MAAAAAARRAAASSGDSLLTDAVLVVFADDLSQIDLWVSH
jgi:hypothetical protein